MYPFTGGGGGTGEHKIELENEVELHLNLFFSFIMYNGDGWRQMVRVGEKQGDTEEIRANVPILYV